MQADFEAALQVDQFIASASIGYAPDAALGAVITRDPENNWASRQHWPASGSVMGASYEPGA